MTPRQYKARYESLTVSLAGGGSATVKINKYRNRHHKSYNEATATAFLNKLAAARIDTELLVDSGPETFRILHRNRDSSFTVNEMTETGPQRVNQQVDYKFLQLMARYVFAGKGAPEHCQIVLQLADHWKLAPRGLQAYADDALGLDCNGFVGNYLWHGLRRQPWKELGLNASEGPDSSIGEYLQRKKKINGWNEMVPGRCYILGLVNSAGTIVAGGGDGTNDGHIAITEPSLVRPPDSFGRVGIYVVEATGAHDPGLWESWYGLEGTSAKFPGVFNVNREEMIAGHQHLSFRMAEVT
jgi:hypothetical protein